jgi:muramoyltetrapeptide carboxypeptidase
MGSPSSRRIRPPALRPGDGVGIVAPASWFDRAQFELGCETLRRLGYEPIFNHTIFEHDLYFAGSVERRVAELEEMFVREEVRAILCARGGYGTNHLLPALDIERILAHPKIFMGYSDVTSLLTWFCDHGLIVFHGPMVAKDFAAGESGFNAASWDAAVSGSGIWRVNSEGAEGLAEGSGEGILYGGCLSMLAASLGTPYEIRSEGKLLFIEDVAAKPYQVDRMLMQLKLAGKFEGVRGVIFGEMLDCVQHPQPPYTLQQIVKRVLADLEVPIAYGVRSGHVSGGNLTLPLGVNAKLQVGDTVTLTIAEAAVKAAPQAEARRV